MYMRKKKRKKQLTNPSPPLSLQTCDTLWWYCVCSCWPQCCALCCGTSGSRQDQPMPTSFLLLLSHMLLLRCAMFYNFRYMYVGIYMYNVIVENSSVRHLLHVAATL